jgi:hypothetical protein
MKIDKIVFSCSEPEEYSSFWNMQSRLWNKMGIEPVCLLYGKKANTDMTEEFGTIIEKETVEGIPWVMQLTCSKFHHPTTEPDKTWIIGDMDMIPLKKAHFTTQIEGSADDHYLHLNASGISAPRLGDRNGFLSQGSQCHAKHQGRNGGADLPAHYHVAKGSKFNIFFQGRTFLEQMRFVVDSHEYGMGPMEGQPRENAEKNPYWYYWLAEENYTSELLWNSITSGETKFDAYHYHNSNDKERVDRSAWSDGRQDYTYNPNNAQRFVDVHCVRPYKRTKAAVERLIEMSGILR